jgi:hypothetical protein
MTLRADDPRMTTRRFPAPWRTEKMPGGYVVHDAIGQALAYVYSREADARQAKVLRTTTCGRPDLSDNNDRRRNPGRQQAMFLSAFRR